MKKHTRVALGGIALAAALAVTACSGNAGEAEPGDASAAESVPLAQSVVADASELPGEFQAPGPAIDASQLAGGTVWVVVPDTSFGVFQQYIDYLTEAFGVVGLDVQSCGATGTAADQISNCLTQALDDDPIAVVSVTIPYELAPTAFQAITDAGVPLVYGSSNATGPGDPKQVAYMTPDQFALQAWNAAWVTADSGGDADVLVTRMTDNEVLQSWTNDGQLAEFEKLCPDCVINVKDISAGNIDKIAPEVSASMVSSPQTGYVTMLDDSMLDVVLQGVKAAGRSGDDIALATAGANLAPMQLLAQEQYLGSVSGFSVRAISWYMADQALRMATGNPAAQDVDFPYIRLFTRENVKDLQLTQGAQSDGSWYGAENIDADFRALWGIGQG
ncbi:MAG: sugar ABC transporter substrate-binding protein [Leucobacter sp.]